MPLRQPVSHAASIRAEEAERREQTYTVTLSEWQRCDIMTRLERLKANERTKPERALIKLLRDAKPNPRKRKPKPPPKPKKVKPLITQRQLDTAARKRRKEAQARAKAEAEERDKKRNGRRKKK